MITGARTIDGSCHDFDLLGSENQLLDESTPAPSLAERQPVPPIPSPAGERMAMLRQRVASIVIESLETSVARLATGPFLADRTRDLDKAVQRRMISEIAGVIASIGFERTGSAGIPPIAASLEIEAR